MALETVDHFLLGDSETPLWELFHENSKTNHYERHPTFTLWPSDAAVVQMMKQLYRVKPYDDFPKFPLPSQFPPSKYTFEDIVQQRESARGFGPDDIPLDWLAKVLFMSYGITRSNEGTIFPRPFRAVPSGGALYPLEIYLYPFRVDGLEQGLYHYNSEAHLLNLLRSTDDKSRLLSAFVQPELVRNAAVLILITAIFSRTLFKYGDRGYRFVMIEAGHLAQNAILTAGGLGLNIAPVGGYMDREIDSYLGVDGLNESTIYALVLGQP